MVVLLFMLIAKKEGGFFLNLSLKESNLSTQSLYLK
jgi:hypothetical protein